MTGIVFDIQRYSIHDGPGIRTVVFLKGCPLRCLWCCNPESQRAYVEVEFRARLCQHCGRCIAACPLGAINPDPWLGARPHLREVATADPHPLPEGEEDNSLSLAQGEGQGEGPAPKIDRARCDNCGKCVEACPNGALRLVGKQRTVAEVLGEVLRDAAYYRRSGGGVTLSGGEPLAQPAFARELLKACYERNVHTAIETTGCVSWSLYEAILPFTELFLFDMKHTDSEAHRRLTGIPNETIVENARRLAAAGAQIILRVPLIPGCNLEGGQLRAVADLAASLNVLEVHLMPFHQLGKDKYTRLDRRYELGTLAGLREAQDGPEKIRWAREIMARRGLKVFIGG